MTDHTDKVAITLMAMSDAEFKRRYLRPRSITREGTWGRRPPITVAEEDEHAIAPENLTRYPSNMTFIRTWEY